MKKTIAIFGGGPASLILASFLDPALFHVTIYEQNKTCGRKFLVAGKGGFNLTHAEPLETLKSRYIPHTLLEDALNHFTNEDLRSWLSKLGIETFVGSSNRIFPVKGIKPIQVLDAILQHILAKGVEIEYQMKWEGWSDKGVPIVNQEIEVKADYVVFAFGGASWKITGSTGGWAVPFRNEGITVNDFEPSNCAFQVNWPVQFLESAEGKPLKNIAVECEGKVQKGELVVTEFGLEGNAIYALSDNIRKLLGTKGKTEILLDFKPTISEEDLRSKVVHSKSRNSTDILKRDLNLSKVQIQLIKHLTSKEDFINREQLVEIVKKLSITVDGTAPIDEAISTIGGVNRQELTDHFEIKKMPKSFCIGEMVDWDAPTGGYLLQGCFSMGVFLADCLNNEEI